MGARAVRDLGLALRSGPFRVALAISLIVHLVLLVVISWGGRSGGSERRIPLMRVRILSPTPQPSVPPTAPEPKPAVRQPRRDSPKPPAPAEAVSPPQAPQPQTTVAPAVLESAPAAATAPAPAEAAAVTAGVEQGGQEAPAAGAPGVVAAPLTPDPAGWPQPSLAVVVPRAGPAIASGPPASAGSGSGGAAGAAIERGAPRSGEIAAAGPAAAGAAVAAGGGGQREPGPPELAAVRRRIDARKVYPQIAVRNGWEGRVLVEMRLEGDGRLAAVRLLEGSGYAVLDDETLAAVRRASPFPPVARVLTVPVEYRLVP
jgi:protein TonB